jgi:hypothetical protein
MDPPTGGHALRVNSAKDHFSFSAPLLAGYPRAGARAPAVAFACEPKKSRLLGEIFLEGPQPEGRRERQSSVLSGQG